MKLSICKQSISLNNPEVEFNPQGQALIRHIKTSQEQDETISNMFKIFGDVKLFKNYIDLSNANVLECISSYINNHYSDKDRKSSSNLRSLSMYIQRLQTESGVIFKPEVIGEEFMRRFDNYLSTKCNMASNTIANRIGLLKNVLRWAHNCGATISPSLDRYKVKTSDARPKVTITTDELYKLYYFDIDNCNCRKMHKETLKKVRDHFILSCFIGQRYSDCKRITEKNFEGTSKDVFKITQQKTGNHAVVEFSKIYEKIPRVVKVILERYNYTAPYTRNLCDFNRYLHELCKLAGIDEEYKFETKVNGVMVTKTYKKYELISSHCGRRTFVSAAVNNKIHTEEIKRATGHKSYSSFSKYVILND